jgi:hypothetical protein
MIILGWGNVLIQAYFMGRTRVREDAGKNKQ